MALKVRFLSSALIDLSESIAYYEDKQLGLGGRFYKSLLESISYLKENPKAFVEYKKGTRQITLKDFPYIVLYKSKTTEIVVIAIFHTSQNPSRKP